MKTGNANEHFGSPLGTDNYYRHPLSRVVYTDGVKALCTECNSYWFLDLIVSHQLDPKVKEEEFQTWKLTRTEEGTATAICDDGNGNVITSQDIPFTDFPYESCTMWLTNNTILLPTEY